MAATQVGDTGGAHARRVRGGQRRRPVRRPYSQSPGRERSSHASHDTQPGRVRIWRSDALPVCDIGLFAKLPLPRCRRVKHEGFL